MLQYDRTPLAKSVDRIIHSHLKNDVSDIKVVVHTEKDDLEGLKVIAFDRQRNYLEDLGEHISITVYVGLGEYIHRVQDHYMNLEASVYLYPLNYFGQTKRHSSRFLLARYKANLDFTKNPDHRNSELKRLDEFDLNSKDMVQMTLTLMDRSLEALIPEEVSGVFQNQTNSKLLLSVLGSRSALYKVEGKAVIDAINISPVPEEKPFLQCLVPAGTRLLDLPTLLHKRNGGLYPGGVGTFIQPYNGKKVIFVYPLYRQVDTGKLPKLLLYRLPSDRYPTVDNTYLLEGNLLSAVVSERHRPSNDDARSIDGFRAVDAGSLTAKPVEITEDGPVANAQTLVNDVVHRERKDGVYISSYVKGLVTENLMVASEQVLSKSVKRFDLVWENSRFDLLYPGMPVEYRYLNTEKEMVTVTGVLLFAHGIMSQGEKGMGSNKYHQSTFISIATY